MPFIILAAVLAKHAHAADRQVDVARQEYALHVAEFDMKYHTNLIPSKKGVILYDPRTNTVSNQNINDTYHTAGHNSITKYNSNAPQPAYVVNGAGRTGGQPGTN
jgi:hypothetical protein